MEQRQHQTRNVDRHETVQATAKKREQLEVLPPEGMNGKLGFVGRNAGEGGEGEVAGEAAEMGGGKMGRLLSHRWKERLSLLLPNLLSSRLGMTLRVLGSSLSSHW